MTQAEFERFYTSPLLRGKRHSGNAHEVALLMQRPEEPEPHCPAPSTAAADSARLLLQRAERVVADARDLLLPGARRTLALIQETTSAEFVRARVAGMLEADAAKVEGVAAAHRAAVAPLRALIDDDGADAARQVKLARAVVTDGVVAEAAVAALRALNSAGSDIALVRALVSARAKIDEADKALAKAKEASRAADAAYASARADYLADKRRFDAAASARASFSADVECALIAGCAAASTPR